MKYKVGDKVKVRSDLEKGDKQFDRNITASMAGLSGKTATITECNQHDGSYHIAPLWEFWTDEMFEGLEEGKMKAIDFMVKVEENKQAYIGKKYKVSSGAAIGRNGEAIEFIHVNNNGINGISKSGDECSLRVYVTDNTELKEIKPEPKPITFTEAVKAAIEGKRPTIVLDGVKHIMTAGKSSYGNIGYWLKVKSENGITYGISTGMIDGMWTIED